MIAIDPGMLTDYFCTMTVGSKVADAYSANYKKSRSQFRSSNNNKRFRDGYSNNAQRSVTLLVSLLLKPT